MTRSLLACVAVLYAFDAGWLSLTQEIKFGDNDTLSAITSSMIHADYLFLLTDVDGLYTTNPRKDPGARKIDVVTSVTDIRSQGHSHTLIYHIFDPDLCGSKHVYARL